MYVYTFRAKETFPKYYFCVYMPNYQFYTSFVHVLGVTYFFLLLLAKMEYNLSKI